MTGKIMSTSSHRIQAEHGPSDSEVVQAMLELGRRSRAAARVIARADVEVKNRALLAIAERLLAQSDHLLQANEKDMKAGEQKGLAQALLDRLQLTTKGIAAMAEGLRQIATLNDPVGQMTESHLQPNGLRIARMRVPLGVIGIIYESRPNVTADAAGLCLKSGNATVLRGGSEALHSNQAIAQCIAYGLQQVGLPEDVVQIVNTTNRAAVGAMISMPEYIDVIIPRGGKSLIERISREAKVPVIKHLDGICHVYIDKLADHEKAVAIAMNAKTQRYGTCNTLETLLIHVDRAEEMLAKLIPLFQQKQVELRGCKRTCAFDSSIKTATEQDWSTEYLAPILSIKIVDSIEQAIDHIENYGSHHTDAIITQDITQAEKFIREVDSSSVMVNASTRFADGFEYGLGAEIGISTDKLHARGPVGLEGLTSLKYVVNGDGQIRR